MCNTNVQIWDSLSHDMRKRFLEERKKKGGKLKLIDWYLSINEVEIE